MYRVEGGGGAGVKGGECMREKCFSGDKQWCEADIQTDDKIQLLQRFVLSTHH